MRWVEGRLEVRARAVGGGTWLRLQGCCLTFGGCVRPPAAARVASPAACLPPRLQVPIAVRDTRARAQPGGRAWRVVSWIDSKATFGDDRTHAKQLEEQYST